MITTDQSLVLPETTPRRVARARANAGPLVRSGWAGACIASVAVAALARGGGPGGRATTAIVGVLFATAALVDVQEHRLPNRLLAAATVAALVGAVLEHRLGSALIGLVIAGGLMLLVRTRRGVGLGDVKMAAAVGASVGTGAVVAAPVSLAVASFVAASAGLVMRRQRLPLGPSLWLGWAVATAFVSAGWWA